MKKIVLLIILVFSLFANAQTPALRHINTYGDLEYSINLANSTGLSAHISDAQSILDNFSTQDPYYSTLLAMLDNVNCIDCNSKIQVQITSPVSGDSVNINQWITIETSRIGEDEHTPYIHINNTSTGYVKMKLGYEGNIYGTPMDVIAGGNTHLEITLKALNGSTPAWSAIRIRPDATGSLNLGSYIVGSMNDYTTLSIPLTDFDPAIDFTALQLFEFPYSADAGSFELAINSMVFTGGSTPFEWFGENHFNNPHDGATSALFGEIISVIPDAVYTDTLFLYVDDTLRDFSVVAPYALMYESPSIGAKSINVVLKDNKGLYNYSDTVQMNFYKAETLELIVEFSSAPTYAVVDKAPLLYNKDFAYSLTLDDGRNDHYDFAYHLLNGGTVEEVAETFPGLFYTDGTGTDIPFNAGLAWNSVSTSYAEIHEVTPSYITWSELIELYDAGWDVYNHGYSHNTTTQGVDIDYEIMANDTAIRAHTTTETHPPILTNHFILPSADLNFTDPALAYGYKAIYSNTNTYTGYPDGVIVDDPYDPVNLTMYRRLIYDDIYDTTNIMDYINQTALASDSATHYWINDFTHRCDTSITGASLTWTTFKYYMQTIESTYGKSGSDNVWFASLAEVQEYLRIRNETYINESIDTTTLTININVANIPEYIRRKELSLLLDSDLPIQNVQINFNGTVLYNTTDLNEQLINIKW